MAGLKMAVRAAEAARAAALAAAKERAAELEGAAERDAAERRHLAALLGDSDGRPAPPAAHFAADFKPGSGGGGGSGGGSGSDGGRAVAAAEWGRLRGRLWEALGGAAAARAALAGCEAAAAQLHGALDRLQAATDAGHAQVPRRRRRH